MSLKGATAAMCIKDKSKLYVLGTIRAPTFNMIDLRLNTCINSTAPNSTVCASDADMRTFFSGVSLKSILTSYLDFSQHLPHKLLL